MLKNLNLKNERGFIPFLLLLVVLYLILKYSYNFDVIDSLKTNGLPYTVGHFFSIMWSWWTDHVKPFFLEVVTQSAGVVKPPTN